MVLVKSDDLSVVNVFEFDTIRYDPDLYYWGWNKNLNLEGFEKSSKEHRFTWQPHGSQFTILEDISQDCIIIRIQAPHPLDKETVLKSLNFTNDWITILKKNG